MSLATELERLATLHASGTLSNDEFSAAKAALIGDGLSGQAGDTLAPARSVRSDEDEERRIVRLQLEELKRANAIAELDHEWALQRKSFMMTGRHDGGRPYRYRPTRGGGVVRGVVIMIFGVLWTIKTASMSSMASNVSPLQSMPFSPVQPMDGGGMDLFSSLFPMFGVLFILFGLWVSYWEYTQAGALESAEEVYHRRRAALLAGQDDPGATLPPTRSTAVADEIDEDSTC